MRDPPTVVWTVLLLAVGGCVRPAEIRPTGPQAYYQTAYPPNDVSGDLERTLLSVVRIQATGSYSTFVFTRASAPTESELGASGGTVLARAVDTLRSNTTLAATGIAIASEGDRLTILSVNHAISFPDTIVEFFVSEGSEGTVRESAALVERVSFKTEQKTLISSPMIGEPLEILARDPRVDLALLGMRLRSPADTTEIRPLTLTFGDSRSLSWASFVYVLGYPAGFRMVTPGIVSEPDRRNGTFLIDGLWNQGISGGPILAMRGDGTGLEWVGVARAAAARTESRLVPQMGAESVQDARAPYEGSIFLQPTPEIRYGITFSVPLTSIRQFLDAHRADLRRARYPLPGS